jgi:hypothetical protein
MIRFAASAALAAFVATMAAPAFAATGDTLSQSDAQDLCRKLETQFQDLTPFKKGLPYWKDANAEAQKGEQACKGSNAPAGAKDMQAAISDMYVKPDTL